MTVLATDDDNVENTVNNTAAVDSSFVLDDSFTITSLTAQATANHQQGASPSKQQQQQQQLPSRPIAQNLFGARPKEKPPLLPRPTSSTLTDPTVDRQKWWNYLASAPVAAAAVNHVVVPPRPPKGM